MSKYRGRMWECETCGNLDNKEPWNCPGCDCETCDGCFESYAHCKVCSGGAYSNTAKTEELRVAANAKGWDFEPDET